MRWIWRDEFLAVIKTADKNHVIYVFGSFHTNNAANITFIPKWESS